MPRTITFVLTTASTAICLYHLLGFDHDHVVLYQASIPAWILPIFMDVKTINKYVFYALTIGSWFFIGLWMDHMIAKARRRNRSSV